MKRLLLCISLLAASVSPSLAQSTTHLNVPSANMVVITGYNNTPGPGLPVWTWSVYQNGVRTSSASTGAFIVPAGKALVITDVSIETNAQAAQDVGTWMAITNNGSFVTQFLARALHGSNSVGNQIFSFALTGGVRVGPSQGITPNVQHYFNTDTTHVSEVEFLGYYTN